MSHILFIDTETTGFVDERMPPDHDCQPWLVQLSAELCGLDGKVSQSFSFIVRPGIEIPTKAAEIYGITTDIANNCGVKPETALGCLRHLYQRTDLVVAHNIKFDVAVLETALIRSQSTWNMEETHKFCTMEASAPILNLEPSAAMKASKLYSGKPKAPKLTDAYRFFFNEDLVDAHDSRADVAACRKIYFALKAMGEKA